MPVMDNAKDISKKESGPDYFKDISIRTRAFGTNAHGEKGYQRAERVVAALFLVTNHIEEVDVLRRHVRLTALRLLTSILGLKDEMRVEHSSNQESLKTGIRKLITLVRLLVVAGRISVQNGELLVEALDDLGIYLNAAQKTSHAESVVLEQEDFIVQATPRFRPIGQSVSSKGHVQRQSGRNVVDAMSDKNGRSETRTDTILALLKPGSNLGIKDLVAQLPEYSEKMIQRELKRLVSLGKVSKTGAKRWSLYSLAQ